MGDFQENPVLYRNRLRQIKHHRACFVQTVGCGAIGACFLTRELPIAGFPNIRHATSIAQHIRPAAPSAKSVPTLSTPAQLSGQFCAAFRVVGQDPAGHHGAEC